MRKLAPLALVMLITSACACGSLTETGAAPNPAPGPPVMATAIAGAHPAARGLAFAKANCSNCHAVANGQLSPNPEAPPFEAVVNTSGLTAETLTPWLRNSHNFPVIMNFAIDPGQIDDLAAYMITLQKSDYTPPTS